MSQPSSHVRRITISAVFLSISLVLKTAFSFYIPMFGQNGLSIGVSGVFSVMPSLLFGPWYGAAVSGLADVLGHFLKPAGTYLPLMTLVVAMGGFIRGALWSLLRKRASKNMRIAIAALSAILLLVGVVNMAMLAADGVDAGFYDRVTKENIRTDDMHLISRLLIIRTMDTKTPAVNLANNITFVTAGIIGSAVLGMILLLADALLSKSFLKGANKGMIPQLLIAMIVSGLIVTTLNTVVLRETIFPTWKVLPFAAVWIPRAIEEVLSNTVKAYFVAVLLGVMQRQQGMRQ